LWDEHLGNWVYLDCSPFLRDRLGYAYHKYQDRLPLWARVPAKKGTGVKTSAQQPHLQKQLKELQRDDHDKLSKDIKVHPARQSCSLLFIEKRAE
jgi:hypothetical protein